MDPQLRILQKKRTANFREDETKLLIQLWGSPIIQNKLFLTHRKAPVMRLLAANMQQRGFYRTPDEIKTRIRNLKCLYHRIKRTIASGQGVGTVDPDWPHYKAMDAILSKEYPRRAVSEEKDKALEGPKLEDIKQEIEDIDIHDDMESWATNDSLCSEYEDDEPSPTPPPPLRPAPLLVKAKEPPQKQIQPKPMPIITPGAAGGVAVATTYTLPSQNTSIVSTTNSTMTRAGTVPSMMPLLILNGLPQQNLNNQMNKDGNSSSSTFQDGELSKILTQILDVQKENLTVQKEQLELRKQKLEINKLVATQMVQLVPMMSGFLQLFSRGREPSANKRKLDQDESSGADDDVLKDSKILRSTLERGIKKYMMQDQDDDKDDTDVEQDSGIQNDDASVSSDK